MSDTIHIEILEPELKDMVNGVFTRLEKGDKRHIPTDQALRWIGHGWANDLSGNVATGTRKPGASAPIVPDKVEQAQG